MKNLDKLTKEQLQTLVRWEHNRAERISIYCEIDKLKQLNSSKLKQLGSNKIIDLLNKLRTFDTELCDHDRSTSSHCVSCEEILKIVYPERFSDDENL